MDTRNTHSSDPTGSHAEDKDEVAERPSPGQLPNGLGRSNIAGRRAKPSTWTDLIPRTDHNLLFLECDYGLTTLGPTSRWGPALRAYATMAFAQNRGACVYWGPDRVALYNEQFAVSCGGAHPFLMGHAFAEAFPEIAPQINPVFEMASSTGQAVDLEDIQLFVRRHGFLEETYFLGQFIPLRGDTDQIEGIYNTIIETTAEVISERNRQIIDGIASIPPGSVEDTITAFVATLHNDPYDYTAVLVYSFDELAPNDTDNVHLVGSLGVPDGHGCALGQARLETCQDGLIPYFRKAAKTSTMVVVSTGAGDGSEPTEMFAGIDWRGYGEPSREIVICSVEIGGQLLGFFAQGTNPRRAYNDTAERQIAQAVTQLKVKWAAAISQEQARAREQALKDRAMDSENRLQDMARSAPIGMCQLGPDMTIQWANAQFFAITGHDPSKPGLKDVMGMVDGDQRAGELSILDEHLAGTSRTVREVRLARTWTPPITESVDTEPFNAWILSVTFPLIEDGKFKMLYVFVTDISRQKWAEGVQARNAAAAIQAERRQEAFLDITSHELRNPLSAITQLADGIARCLDRDIGVDPGDWREIVEDNSEAAKTILACVAQQKRVVDDILLLSRLDSQIVSISPTDTDISQVVKDTIKMFDAVATSSDIRLTAARSDNTTDMRNVKIISTDAARLMQVLINLLGNAIKFTASQAVREIQITYGVQAQQPSSLGTNFGNLTWFPHMRTAVSTKTMPIVGNSEERLCAYFLVQDTGPGLTAESTSLLFKRFSQATTKTQVAYGGSGLGLYICRTIVEMLGGSVGVASKYGQGSAFAFYLQTKAVDHASHAIETVCSTQAHETAVSDPVETPHKTTTPPPNGFDILLVEDNLINQRILAKQLRKAGCNVTVANDGLEALEVIERSDRWRCSSIEDSQPLATPIPIEVVLMDVEMPRMNGKEATKEIRRLELEGKITRQMPVIATTANARQGQQDDLIASGVDMVLTKPFTTGVLLSKISHFVRQYSAQV